MAFVALAIASCSGTQVSPQRHLSNSATFSSERFAEAGFEGSAALLRRGVLHCADCRARFSPASTFKVPNALIALDLGMATPESRLEWDGVERSIAAWNQDHTLRTAVRDSVVWYFQDLARRIGPERYEGYLRRFAYGNQNLGSEVDAFWLNDSLQVSPEEQVLWWRRLHDAELGVSAEARDGALAITIVAEDDVSVLRAKTGWRNEAPIGGWFVGSLEIRGQEVVPFAVHIRGEPGYDRRAFLAARRRIAEGILRDFGLPVPQAE